MAGRKWVKTDKELAAELGMSPKSFYKTWKKKPGFPARTKRGWNVEKCQAFVRNHKRVQAAGAAGPNADEQRRKLKLQADMLEQKLLMLQGDAIAIEDYRRDLEEYARIVNGVFDQFLQEVAALRNSRLLKKAKALATRARERLVKALEGLK